MNSLLIEDLTRKEIATLLSIGYDTVLLNVRVPGRTAGD